MQKNKRIVHYAGAITLLAALSLEEQAHAKQNPNRIQSALENKSTLSSSVDPIGSLNAWQSTVTQKSMQSKTTSVQTNSLSALENLKQQTSQLSRSLRSTQGVSEGRFEAPGLMEFTNYIQQSQKSSTQPTGRNDEIDKLRTATIQSIEKILRQPAGANQRVDLMLRLAELHTERHTEWLIREMQTYEMSHDKWLKNNRRGAEPQISQVQSMQSLQSATQILRDVVNQFTNHPRTPDALYQLGFLLTEMKSDSAVLYFQRLIDRFPKSKFILDAHLALGEFYFSRNKFVDAQAHYQKVLNDRNHRAYPYAVYKLGWTFFNIRNTEEQTQQNLRKSLVAFKLLVKFAQESGKEKKLSILRKDALRDMVLVYAELADVDEAQKYFKSVGEPALYTSLLERLAWLHADSGRNREAIDIYNRLVQEFPLNPKNPQFLVRLAGLYEKDQNRNQMIEVLHQLSNLISNGSTWSKAQANAQELEAAKNLLFSEGQTWSLRLHAEFQKTKNKTTATQALSLYNLTLHHLGEHPNAYIPLYNRSQLHTVLEDHEKAIDGYAQAAWIDKKFSLKKAETKIALENAIAESDLLIQRRGPVQSSKNATMPFLESRLVKLIDFHAAMYPKDNERLALLHRAALIHFQAGLIPQATQRWTAIAKDAPLSTFTSDGLRLVIKRSFDAQNWSKSIADARAFLNINGIAAAPVGAQISKLLRVSMFQNALQTEKGGRHEEAARLFLDYQKEFPSDSDAGKALINAANNQFKANRPEEAHKTLSKFVSTYPTSEYQVRALEMMAMTAEGMGRFAEAADSYEQMAQKKSNKEQSALDRAHAAGLWLAAQNPQKAISNAEVALPNLKRPADVCETFKILTDAQSMQRSPSLLSSALAATEKCQLSSPELGIYFTALAARLHLSAGHSGEASRLASVALSRGKVLNGKLQNPFAFEGLRVAGQVQLSMLEKQSQQILARRVQNAASINPEFSKIRIEAQQLAQQYVQLSQSGQPETSIGAMYRIAELQEGLANILIQSPNPQNVSPAESENFRAKIEKIALPLQEESAKLFAQALEKASEAEIMSNYTLLLKDKLATIRPLEHRKIIEVMPKPFYFAHELPMNKEAKGVVEEN